MNRLLTWLAFLTVFAASAVAAPPDTPPVYDRAADSHGFTVFMQEGGWCWYQDPRAILHDGKLFIGAVRGNGSGPALVGIYDLNARKQLGTVTMRDNFGRDDHNSPVFFARPDGSVLAIYALHGKDKVHRYRISDPENPLSWGKERWIDHDATLPTRDRVTYMNLLNMSGEGKLYNFYRGFEFNPSFVTSGDSGLSWGEDTHFIESEVKGYQRPYARYAGNGIDAVHVSFTDAHPRNFGNSIYYALFRRGKFYKADGTFIKDLKQDGPLLPREADLIFRGSGQQGGGKHGVSAPKSAWTSSIACDADGHPHIGYSYYLSNADHRYRIASWDGKGWIDREVAYAGNCLYDRESSYTGLITLDPIDPSVVVISTDVDPTTGKDSGGTHEIYRAEVDLHADVKTIKWKAVTKDSPVRNLRPLIVSDGNTRVILWNRGDFKTYVNYKLDTVGIVESMK